MSGFLYGRKTIVHASSWLKKNAGKILCDYYVYLLIIIPLYYFFVPDSIGFEQILRLLLGVGGVAGLGHLWFVSAILLCYIITPFLQYIKEKHNRLSIWLLCFCVSEFVGLVQEKLTGTTSATWINCYVLGYFFAQKGNAKKFILYFLSSVGFVLFVFEGIANAAVEMHIEGLPKHILTLLFRNGRVFAATGVVYFFATTVQNTLLGKRPLMKLLKWSDKYSYDFYICHHIYILGYFSLLQYIGGLGGILLCGMIAVLSAMLLRCLSRGTADFFTRIKNSPIITRQ